jgi:hypothetical protein
MCNRRFSVAAITSPPRSRARARLAVTAVALVAAAGGLAGLGASSASAASRISGCFSYAGIRYQNLSTNVLYQTTDGGWRFLAGSVARTDSNGCIAYNISGRPRDWHLRIRATGAVPNWRGMFDGLTPYFGGGDGRSYQLGEGRLSFYYLPATAQTPPDSNDLTSSWLDGMSSGGNGGGCSSSGAMLVACYMDAHGMHGNVVVNDRDTDGDGWFDWQDNRPQDPSLR